MMDFVFLIYYYGIYKGGFIMLADYHIHSEFSDDSVCPMETVIKYAIAQKLDEICFTEHIDYGVKTDLNCDCEKSLMNFKKYRQIYKDKINLKWGMEFGIQTKTIDQYKELFKKYPFDFIICSCHQVDNLEFWNYEFQKNKTQAQYNLRYYAEILNVIRQYKDYSVIGHLDMIKRYDECGDYPFEKTAPIIEEILKQVIADKKGIEVNTSCYRYGIKDLTPSINILKMYKQLGGEIITIGSDGHKEGQYGFKIAETQKILKDLGFKYFYTYDKMQPMAHKL